MSYFPSASSKRSKLYYKAILKNILVFIMRNSVICEKIIKKLNKLSKVDLVVKLEKNSNKERELLCFRCGQMFTNKLCFILHLELIHKDDFSVNKYEFQRDKLMIYIDSKPEKALNFIEEEQNHLFLKGNPNQRMEDILNVIFLKFTNKRSRKGRRVYYHSNNIFSEIGPSSQEEDSEKEVEYIERDLERNRINQFTDVNEKDKKLFYIWNEMVHEHKKAHKIIDHREMVKILDKFATECKKQGIKRINFFTHAWTLWSAGKIAPEDVSSALTVYDGFSEHCQF